MKVNKNVNENNDFPPLPPPFLILVPRENLLKRVKMFQLLFKARGISYAVSTPRQMTFFRSGCRKSVSVLLLNFHSASMEFSLLLLKPTINFMLIFPSFIAEAKKGKKMQFIGDLHGIKLPLKLGRS